MGISSISKTSSADLEVDYGPGEGPGDGDTPGHIEMVQGAEGVHPGHGFLSPAFAFFIQSGSGVSGGDDAPGGSGGGEPGFFFQDCAEVAAKEEGGGKRGGENTRADQSREVPAVSGNLKKVPGLY